MQPSFVNKFAAIFLLVIVERASAASTFPWAATNGQFEDITNALYTDDVTPTSNLADVTDAFTALGEVADYTTTSFEHIPSFTPTEASDVVGLASTIDASSVVVSTTGADAFKTTTPLKYASINTTQLAATGELITSAEITHLNGRTETTIQPTSIKTAPAASTWSLSHSSEGNSVSTLKANTSVGATLGPASLLSADANDFTISMPASSSTDTKKISLTTQATTWQGTYKTSFISSTPATLSGGSKSVANISVPGSLSISTESVTAISIQTNSSATSKSAFPLMPSTSPGFTSSISFSTTLSAATKSFFTSLKLMTSPGTTSGAFSITTTSASLKATSNAGTFVTPVSSSSRTIVLGKFSSAATPPANNNRATTVSPAPASSGTTVNIFTLSKPVTSLGTTTKVSTPKTSRASTIYFSFCQIICALVLSRTFVYFVS